MVTDGAVCAQLDRATHRSEVAANGGRRRDVIHGVCQMNACVEREAQVSCSRLASRSRRSFAVRWQRRCGRNCPSPRRATRPGSRTASGPGPNGQTSRSQTTFKANNVGAIVTVQWRYPGLDRVIGVTNSKFCALEPVGVAIWRPLDGGQGLRQASQGAWPVGQRSAWRRPPMRFGFQFGASGAAEKR